MKATRIDGNPGGTKFKEGLPPARAFFPRLSETKQVLPVISSQLDRVASRHSLCTAVELWPIVEDGLFGYELVPDQQTHSYLILARNDRGEPALRVTSYSVGSPGALQLVAVNGRVLSRSERASRYSIQRRDSVFSDWPAAAAAACEELAVLFPNQSRETGLPTERAHHYLEAALCVAYSHLARWDPFVQFFGVPNEAQLGVALMGASAGEWGHLTFVPPNTWALRWTAGDTFVDQSWTGQHHSSDRRKFSRRASDRSGVGPAWNGAERRQRRRRRMSHRHDHA